MELIDFLHVSEDNEFFVYNARWDLLYATGHFPQVGLPRKETQINARISKSAIPDTLSTGSELTCKLMHI